MISFVEKMIYVPGLYPPKLDGFEASWLAIKNIYLKTQNVNLNQKMQLSYIMIKRDVLWSHFGSNARWVPLRMALPLKNGQLSVLNKT